MNQTSGPVKLSTPVIFLIFNRPELTSRVFQKIREAQPQKLFVVADGPRHKTEETACKNARAITEAVDWDCEVYRNYSDTNLGCRSRVSSGITWAFEKVETAIVLEDDCLPHPSFFPYCQALLDYYQDDERIMMISGDNFQDGQWRGSGSYYFSYYPHCWGWATWRRAWKYWEFSPEKWIEFRDEGFLRAICQTRFEQVYWTDIFNTLFLEDRLDSWAYPWTFNCWSQRGLTVLPNVNLISNIGFGLQSTHTSKKNRFANMDAHLLENIQHPHFVVRHPKADSYTFRYYFGGKLIGRSRWLWRKYRNRLYVK
jgi:hypothetical protein